MRRLELVAAAEQSHAALSTVTKENCSPTKPSSDGLSGHKSPTDLDRLQDAAGVLTSTVSGDKCCSDRSEMESLQRVSGQTSELPPTMLSAECVQVDSRTKAARSSGSVLLPDVTRRPITYNFAGTRHESYGNLGIAGLAGLSSTSATLALLPLQASSGPSRTTLSIPPVTTSAVPTTALVPTLTNTLSSSGNISLDLPEVQQGGKLGGASSGIAASVKDRRSTFFSEPPKPISLPTRSASELSSLCDEGLSSRSRLATNVSSPGSKGSNGPSPSVSSFPRNLSGSFNFSAASVLEMQSSMSPLSRQQEKNPLLAADSSLLCPGMSQTVSGRDVSPMQFSDQSVTSTSDSEDAHFAVWCGPPPDDAATAEPALTADTCIFEIGMFIFI